MKNAIAVPISVKKSGGSPIDSYRSCATLTTPEKRHPAFMSKEIEIIRAEIPEVARIVKNECWLESERRGCAVGPTDAVVRSRVAEIILGGAGAYIRKQCEDANR